VEVLRWIFELFFANPPEINWKLC